MVNYENSSDTLRNDIEDANFPNLKWRNCNGQLRNSDADMQDASDGKLESIDSIEEPMEDLYEQVKSRLTDDIGVYTNSDSPFECIGILNAVPKSRKII